MNYSFLIRPCRINYGKKLVKLPILSFPISSLKTGDYDLAGDRLNLDFQARLNLGFQARHNLGFQARPNVPDLSGTVMIVSLPARSFGMFTHSLSS